jgi:uncharacterized protein YtpQ (UPF0354 family)
LIRAFMDLSSDHTAILTTEHTKQTKIYFACLVG